METNEKGQYLPIHGKANTPTYHSWESMKSRCLNVKNYQYKDYGGRGITICEKWLNFEGFYEDMGEQPDGMQIDRKDNNAGYSLENCR